MKRSNIGWTVILYCLGTSTIFHLYRMIINYGGWDMTIVQLLMIQTLHLSNAAWDYSDGESTSEKPSPTRLKDLPSFLEFFGAALCPSQCLSGPFTHISDYLNYIHRRNEYAVQVDTGFESFKRFLTAVAWLASYGTVLAYIPFTTFYTSTFHNSNFFMRVLFFFNLF